MSNRVSRPSSSPRTMHPPHDETEAASGESASLDDPKKGPKGKESEYKPKTSNLRPDTLKVGDQLADKPGPQFSPGNVMILKRLRINNVSQTLAPEEIAALRRGCASYCQHVITTTIPWAKTAGQRPSLREGCIAVAAYSCWYILPKLLQNFIEPLNKSLGLAAFDTRTHPQRSYQPGPRRPGCAPLRGSPCARHQDRRGPHLPAGRLGLGPCGGQPRSGAGMQRPAQSTGRIG